MDLVRTLLLGMEDPQFDGVRQIHPDPHHGELGVTEENHDRIGYHLILLIEAGLIDGQPGSHGMPTVSRLTWEGHEFLDAVRDESVWKKTKEIGKHAGGTGLDLMFGIAKEVIKGKLAEAFGGAFGG
jgi:hypothetical protein